MACTATILPVLYAVTEVTCCILCRDSLNSTYKFQERKKKDSIVHQSIKTVLSYDMLTERSERHSMKTVKNLAEIVLLHEISTQM